MISLKKRLPRVATQDIIQAQKIRIDFLSVMGRFYDLGFEISRLCDTKAPS